MQPQDILDKNPKLAKRMDHADKIVKYSLVSMVVVMFGLMVFMVIQLTNIQAQITASLEENKRTGTANHEKTQKYVKCIADTLLEPVENRKPADFDKCGIQGTTQTDTKSDSNSTQPSTAPMPAETGRTNTTRNVPTTSAPPEDTAPAGTTQETTPPTGVRSIPVVDGLLNLLGL